ncbi:YEATS family protein, putative [Babesia bigemina]|uniref:YEATS family protein, putative n=1 Tax=Babesia bigemina TaxID=5866 RepID=A0A061D7Y9_BABBI|nr:YEATS family protein, putative [Babesia bigemina]CDR96663.1 YEATS family protein, putative [Babesia bigemina]|eukprot:XP_012768849.1 YEATS family protein, putative [Babesia bigemina]
MSTKSGKRVNVRVGKQIAIGTYAFPLTPVEKKRYGSMTHRWTCLLRSPTNENMTHYVKKVQFDLDPSFLNPRRVLTSMPYEVTEVGWGEFYIGVKIYFVDESLEPVQLQHLLVLNPSDNTGSNATTATNETFDEIIFNEPAAWFYKHLMCSTTDCLPPHKYQEHFWDYSMRDKETTCRYICCQSYFQNETYRLLAEASELSRQIQYLQEKANVIKNPTILTKTNPNSTFWGSKPTVIGTKNACSTPTTTPQDAPTKRDAVDSNSPESSILSSYDPKLASLSPSATVVSSTPSMAAEEKLQLDDKELGDSADGT